MVPYSVANVTKMFVPSVPVWRSSWDTEGKQKKTITWYLVCHLLQLVCHFILIENCLRPFHIFYSRRAVNTLCPPFSLFTTESIADCQPGNAACRLFICLLHILFIFKRLWRAVLHIVSTGLSALDANQNPQNICLERKRSTNKSGFFFVSLFHLQ